MTRVHTEKVLLETRGGFAIENVTDKVLEIVAASSVKDGQVLVFYQHTTGAIILDEFEAGIMADLEDILEEIASTTREYKHHLRAVDLNGWAHIRTALLGASVSIPISGGEALLGRYQQIIVIDMQVEHEPRSVIVQVMGT
jgi:secondary thiamine-phosphate synthase enzyme